MPRNTKSRILARARQIVGDHEKLARQLQVSAVHLANWIDGVTQTPDEVFLKAVDIILAERAILKEPSCDITATRH
jgi:DNA-binding transcriptional regulator YdaS (Cro superfamily)